MELVNQRNVSFRQSRLSVFAAARDHATGRAFVFLKIKRGQLGSSITPAMMQTSIWDSRGHIALWALGQSHTDDQVVAALGKRAHEGRSKSGSPGRIAQKDDKSSLARLTPAHARRCRTLVLAATIEDDTNTNLAARLVATANRCRNPGVPRGARR